MGTERFKRLVVVMAAMAAGDKAAVFSLYNEFWGQLAAAVRRELRRLGVEDAGAEDVEGMVLDACFVLFDCGGAWKPEGGALPWTWATRRIAGVVSDWVGQHADEFDADRTGEQPENSASSPGPSTGDDDEALLAVLSRMAERSARCALVLEALERVATARDQEMMLELCCQIAAGDPSPALTVAARFKVSAEVVRQAASRVRKRLRLLAAADERFDGLGDLGLAA